MSAWTVVIRGDWYLGHLVNMLREYRGNGEQNECRDEVIEQIEAQIIRREGGPFVEGARPVVVIDPQDDDQVCQLVEALRANGWATPDGFSDTAAALRSLIEPPKPEEPMGLGAVVEDADGKQWIRTAPREAFGIHWIQVGAQGGMMLRWRDFAAVRVLSEGVTP